MDLIAQGRITGNLIEPSYELVDTFNTYWTAIMPPDRQAGHKKIRGHQIITAGHFYHYQKDKSVILYPWEKDKCAMSYVRR
jgi:hypothetical protein